MSTDEPKRKFSVEPASNESLKDDHTVAFLPSGLGNPEKVNLTAQETKDFDVDYDYEEEEHDDDPSKVDIYENEYHMRPPMSSMFSKLATYTGGIEPTTEEAMALKEKQEKDQPANKLGTLLGVFLPCIQNIFGVILFLRMSWIAGVAGGLQSFLIVLICCITTFLTALSMSAIATNGKVPAGGSYFMISRSIGPEFGGAVGLLFYFGTTIASAMYIIGAVEVFLKYICPGAVFYGNPSDDQVIFNCTRVYGTVLLLILMCCVFIGIQFVSKFATVSLAAVLISILCIYIGIFTVGPSRSPLACEIGGRLIVREFAINEAGEFDCSKNKTGPLYKLYCNDLDSEECKFFDKSKVASFVAIPGITSGKFFENVFSSSFREKGEHYDNITFKAEKRLGQGPNVADISTSFVFLLAIYFPSVTGIMAGSNRSGDLANAQVSIPRGTVAAILLTSTVYLSAMLLFASVADGRILRDKYGEGIGGGMLVAALGWPHSWVILIGSLLSTIGAGLQSLTGAPRLLQAISKDNIIPFLRVFRHTTKRGEPFFAQLLTYFISQIGILIASIDSITPLVTMFFLMCYGFVNLATALNSLIKEPSWRPRHRFYHWTLSVTGLLLCVILMFISSWYYALIACALAGGIYKYIEYKGASKEWGDATRGLQLTTAKRSILQLGTKPLHTKNWRPQILIYLPLDERNRVSQTRLLDLAYQLKAGKGLTLTASILQGDLFESRAEADQLKNHINELLRARQIKGLPEVLVTNDIAEGMRNMAQCAGLGNLRHNTILASFPDDWRDHDKNIDEMKLNKFMTLIRAAQACNLAMIVPKNIDQFPQARDRLSGTVDMWCVVQDGGLLILIAYLLLRSRTWSRCSLRIFLVATETVNTIDLKRAMSSFVFDLRIKAEVDVVEMTNADISAYSAQRTIAMQNRQQMLQELNLGTDSKQQDIQTMLDQAGLDLAQPPVQPILTQQPTLTVSEEASSPVPSPTGPTGETAAFSPDLSDQNSSMLATPTATDGKSTGSSVTFASGPGPAAMAREATDQIGNHVQQQNTKETSSDRMRLFNEFTFSPGMIMANSTGNGGTASVTPTGTTSKGKLRLKRRMHSASNLNSLVMERSGEAALVLINLPGPSRTPGSEYNYMDFVETLTAGLRRVLLLRGSGREVITALAE